MSDGLSLYPSPSSATLTEPGHDRKDPARTLTSSASNASTTTASPARAHRSSTSGNSKLHDSQVSMFSSLGHHPTSTNPLFLHGPWFKDHTGRTVTLRGVNLSGASKMPVNGSSHRTDSFLDTDGTEISFIGRPFPLEDADVHLARLKLWGFNLLRFIVTWESIEHAGP
ncbi:hypothetical protein BGZ65_011841, partial [Modicella reniformis]